MQQVAEKYQVMPPLSDEEFEALKADIAERGVQVSVEYDEEGNILDGYHRVQACRELGITDWPRIVRRGWTEEQKRAHARKLNLNRRHLTREQRRELIAEALKESPEQSNRQHAASLGVSLGTVNTVRRELEATEQLVRLDTIVGADGKERPRHVERRAPEFLNNPATWHSPGSYAREAEAPIHDDQPPSPKVEAEVAETPASDVHSPKKANNLEVHFSSERMDWATPWLFFRRLDAEFHFELDVCALTQSAKCGRFFTPEDDGLSQSWSGVCWMNPPYGNEIGDWMRKAYEESRRNATVVCLVPSRTDTNWWHEYAMKADEIRFVRGRLKFDGAETSAPFPSAVVILRPESEGPPRISAVRSDG